MRRCTIFLLTSIFVFRLILFGFRLSPYPFNCISIFVYRLIHFCLSTYPFRMYSVCPLNRNKMKIKLLPLKYLQLTPHNVAVISSLIYIKAENRHIYFIYICAHVSSPLLVHRGFPFYNVLYSSALLSRG